MKKALFPIILALLFISIQYENSKAQQLGPTMFRMAEGFVRIAEPGQLADTLTVWGDVTSSGRYIVPRGTKPHELIGYARGVRGIATNEVALDWGKRRVEINISTYNEQNMRETVERFEFRYSDPFPEDLRQYVLINDQIISLEVKRRPALPDYIRVITPVLSAALTTVLLIDRLQN